LIVSTIVASTRAPDLSNSPTSSPLKQGFMLVDTFPTEETQTQGVNPTVIILICVILGSVCIMLSLCLVARNRKRKRKRKQPPNKVNRINTHERISHLSSKK
jgi:heme/copper-type cytochrome/quinol oxidase subunit 2